MADIESVAKEITEKLSNGAEIVFGKSRVVGDKTIITVAQISYGMGGGGGREKESDSKAGEGSGMGMGAKVIPLGFITVTADNIKYRPIMDVNKFLSLLAVIFGCLCHGYIKKRSRQYK